MLTSCVGKDAVCPTRDIDRDLCSAQFCESLGIQNQEESAFLLHMGPDMGNVTDVLYLIIFFNYICIWCHSAVADSARYLLFWV